MGEEEGKKGEEKIEEEEEKGGNTKLDIYFIIRYYKTLNRNYLRN